MADRPTYYEALIKDLEKGGFEHRIRFQDPQADMMSKNIYKLRKRIKRLVRDLNRSLSTEEQLQEYLQELITFQELVRQVGPVRELDHVLHAIMGVSAEILKSDLVAIYLWSGPPPEASNKAMHREERWFNEAVDRLLIEKKAVDGTETEPFVIPLFKPGEQEEGSLVIIPLHSGNAPLGMLFSYLETSHLNFFQYHFNLFGLFGHQATTALENAMLFEQIRELSVRDDLTKLHNSRYLRSFLEEKAKEADTEHPLALFFLDVDFFKTINDTHGHLVGSRVLVEVASILSDFEQFGCACRYGGDEFVIALPDTTTQRAKELAEDLRFRLESTELLQSDFQLHLTISVGVSVFPILAQSVEELIHQADMAMYKSKEGGKNQIQVWRGT